MQQQMRDRLETLKREHAAGLEALAEIQRREADLRATVLRISGAIQVLEELLAAAQAPPPDPPT